MGGKASGVLGIVIALLGLMLIIAAIRGTYIPVWHALSLSSSPAQNRATAINAGTSAGSAIGSASPGNTVVS